MGNHCKEQQRKRKLNEMCKRNKRGRNDVIIVLKNSKPYSWYQLISTKSFYFHLIHSHGKIIGSEEIANIKIAMQWNCLFAWPTRLQAWKTILYQQSVGMMNIRNYWLHYFISKLSWINLSIDGLIYWWALHRSIAIHNTNDFIQLQPIMIATFDYILYTYR